MCREWLIDRLVGGAGGRSARLVREDAYWRTHPELYVAEERKARRAKRDIEKRKRAVQAALDEGRDARCACAVQCNYHFFLKARRGERTRHCNISAPRSGVLGERRRVGRSVWSMLSESWGNECGVRNCARAQRFIE